MVKDTDTPAQRPSFR